MPWGDLSTGYGNNDLVAMHTHAVSGSMTMPEGALHPIPQSRLRGRENRPEPVAVGTIIWLASELMFFAALFAAYFTIRNVTNSQAAATGTVPLWQSQGDLINIPFAILNTSVLVASSFTCQMGVFAAERGDVFGLRRWYVVTFMMGLFFVLGQGYEYIHLVDHGTTIPGSAYGSVFYLATGFHALHVIVGMVLFGIVLGQGAALNERWSDWVENCGLYWHFVDLVWIFLFPLIYIVPGI